MVEFIAREYTMAWCILIVILKND